MGSRSQQAAQVLLLAWQIDAALVLLLCVRHISTLVASHDVWKPKSRQFRSRMLIEHGPHFRLEAVPKMKTENLDEKMTSFGSITLMIDLRPENVGFLFSKLFLKWPFRLIIMRIRLRASDFGLVAKIKIIRAKSTQASCAEMVLGSFVFCSCGSAVTFLDSENSSQHRLLLRPAPCRAHFARPWTRASKLTLRL